MSGTALLPDLAELETRTFSTPWAARLFGVTVALTEAGVFSLGDFQAALIAAVGDFEKANCIDDEEAYYTRWLEALLSLLSARGIVAGSSLSGAEAAVTRRLLDLQHERHHQREVAGNIRARIKPLIVA